jgi:putative transposase
MSDTLAVCLYHLVFATDGRRPLLTEDIRPRLFQYLGGIASNLKIRLHIAGGYDDHVHALVEIPPAIAVAEVARDLKANSSRWLKAAGVREFAWQAGYGVFTVSYSARDSVRRYIENQESHHHRQSSADEWRAFVERHGMRVMEGGRVGPRQ